MLSTSSSTIARSQADEHVRCLACASAIAVGANSEKTAFVRCQNCGSIRRVSLPGQRELADLYAKAYSETAARNDQTGLESREGMLQGLATFLSPRYLKSGEKVLDFGASTGKFCSILQKLGAEVHGAELSQRARMEASTRFGFVFTADISTLPASHYGWIVSVEVLEHLTNPGQTLRQLHNLLKPGGRLFLTTPNAAGLAARLHGAKWREARNLFHLALYTPTGLKMLLTRTGYERLNCITFSPIGSASLPRAALHRTLQAVGLYGGLRVFARKAER